MILLSIFIKLFFDKTLFWVSCLYLIFFVNNLTTSDQFRQPKKIESFSVSEAIQSQTTRLLPMTVSTQTGSSFIENNPKSVGKIQDLTTYRQLLTAKQPQQDPQQQQQPSYDQFTQQQASFQQQIPDYQVLARTTSWDQTETRNNGECRQAAQPRQGLRRVLQGAKEMLTRGLGSLERSAFGGNLMVVGSSVLAAAIPLLALFIPDLNSLWRRQQTSIINNNLTYSEPQRSAGILSLQGQLETVMGWIERSVEHLPNFPRLHPQECVKRSICEAHNEPKKYGVIGSTLRFLFPASNFPSSTDRMDNMEFKIINKYKYAAGFGANGTGTPGVCKDKYEDCLINLLDISQFLMDKFLN